MEKRHFMTMVWLEEEGHHLLLLTVAKDEEDAKKRIREQGFKEASKFNFLQFHEYAGRDLVIETNDFQSENFSFKKMADSGEKN